MSICEECGFEFDNPGTMCDTCVNFKAGYISGFEKGRSRGYQQAVKDIINKLEKEKKDYGSENGQEDRVIDNHVRNGSR